MSGAKIAKGALNSIAELLPIERGMLGPTYDWLLKFLGKAPRDEVGRIPLDAISRAEFEALMDLSPRAPGGLVFRGEPGVPTDSPGTFVAKWPRHAMSYAAGEVGTSKKPHGFLSVYDVPWDKLPEYTTTADRNDLVTQLMRQGAMRRATPLPEEVEAAGGARLLKVPDYALGPEGKFDPGFEHRFPQGVIFDKAKLQRKAKGGLVQMKECNCK